MEGSPPKPSKARTDVLRGGMEYGEAISSEAFRRAIEISKRLREEGRNTADAASRGVAQAYCVCVTDGEDAAERQFSEVHRKLIDDVIEHLRQDDRASTNDQAG
jgi:hypothetical protein